MQPNKMLKITQGESRQHKRFKSQTQQSRSGQLPFTSQVRSGGNDTRSRRYFSPKKKKNSQNQYMRNGIREYFKQQQDEFMGEFTNRILSPGHPKLQEINYSSESQIEESKESSLPVKKIIKDSSKEAEEWSDVTYSSDEKEQEEEKTITGSGLMKKLTSSVNQVKNIVTTIKDKINDTAGSTTESNKDSKLSFQDLFLQKYSIKFNIPSLNVHSAIWYPKKPQYFVQIVSYHVPKNSEFDVETHFLGNKPKNVSKFNEIFKDRIKGCSIRLIKTSEKLDSIKLVDQYVFDQTPKVQNLSIAFSNDGKYFVIYSDFIKVYQFQDIEKMLDQIRNGTAVNQLKGVRGVVNVAFDNNTKFMIVRLKYELKIYNLKLMGQQGESYTPECYLLPRDQLESICDYYFRSSDANDNYRCYLACKVQGLKKIKVFNIKHLNRDSIWQTEQNSINFFGDVSEDFRVKMKVDGKSIKAVFINGDEQFTITMEENGESTQQLLTQIGSKKVKHIYLDKYSDEAWCYLVACNDYDEHLHLYKAYDPNYSQQITRRILPNAFKVCDVFVTPEGQMRILSMKDDEFVIDQVKGSLDHKHYIYSSVRAFSANWPYVTFSGLENYLLLINVYKKKVLHRVQFAPLDEYVMVCQTFISETKDLFLVIKRGNMFQVLMLDLDEVNDRGEVDESVYRFVKIIEYSADEVGGANLTSMFVRGSSRKEVIQLNQKQMVFLQHESNIYSWTDGQLSQKGKILTHLNREFQVVSPYILIQDQHTFYYFQISKDREESVSQVCQVRIQFSTYEIKIICGENSKQMDYVGFKIDRAQGILMLFTVDLIGQKQGDRLFVKIFSINDQDNVLLECEVFEQQMKGIFLSQEFTLIDGHIYFNNNIIKLRYDLMKAYGGNGKFQHLYFNQYNDILKLNQGDLIKTTCPIDSPGSHRLTYVVISKKGKPKRLIIVPYLHERKIYLNRMKRNTEYFYTSKQFEESNESLIFAFNLNESKFYTYNDLGLLLKRIEFSDLIKKYGEIDYKYFTKWVKFCTTKQEK